jgi:sortase (surface protein transpeptidase)
MSSHKTYRLHKSNTKKNSTAKTISNIFGVTAVGLLLLAAGSSLLVWRSNNTADQQAKQLVYNANHGRSNAVPSTIKLTASTLEKYEVAPTLPRLLIIPKLSVTARILQVGLVAHGALGTPNNVYDTAWYNQSSQPGQPGAMLIDGHVSSWTAHGVFYGLKTLKPGDAVDVRSGSGAIFSYQVIKIQIYHASNVDMTSAVTPIIAGKPGLNLISCTGDVIPGSNEFNERIIVYTAHI